MGIIHVNKPVVDITLQIYIVGVPANSEFYGKSVGWFYFRYTLFLKGLK